MLANFLKRLRAEGLTQLEIAEKSGLSQSMISKLMNGGNCDLETAYKLSKAFQIGIDEMINTEAIPTKYGNSYHDRKPKPDLKPL